MKRENKKDALKFKVGDLARHKPTMLKGKVHRILRLDSGAYDLMIMLEGPSAFWALAEDCRKVVTKKKPRIWIKIKDLLHTKDGIVKILVKEPTSDKHTYFQFKQVIKCRP